MPRTVERETLSPPGSTAEPRLTLIPPPRGDVRSGRSHGISAALRAAMRRSASVLALVAVDVGGLTLGLYVALALRAVYYGARPPLWGVLWRAETAQQVRHFLEHGQFHREPCTASCTAPA